MSSSNKLWNFNFTYLLLLNAATSIGFNMVQPLISKYTVFIGGTLHFAGIIVGVYALSALIARPLSSVVADRLNKKLLVISSTILMAFFVFSYGFCTNPSMLLVVRFLHGVAFGISGTATTAFAVSYVPQQRMGEGVAYLGVSMVLGQAIGPYMGSVILESHSYQTVFLVSFIICTIASISMLFIKYNHPKRNAADGASKKIAPGDIFAVELVAIGLFAAIFAFMNGSITSYILLVGDERGIANISLFFSIYAIAAIFTRPIAGKLADSKGIAYTVVPAFICSTVALLMISVSHSLLPILVASVFQSIGYGFSTPAFQSQALRMLGAERSGVATGTFFTFVDIGYGVGPIVAGYIAELMGYSFMYALEAGLLCIAFVVFLIWNKKQKSIA